MNTKPKTLKTLKTLFFLLGFTSCLSAWAEQPSPDEVITTMEKLNGVTPGARRNHIMGICANGTFVGSKELKKYSSSALFSGKSIPFVARFSLAGGNPKAPDTAKSPRGLAVEFKLSKNSFQHFTMLNVPVFGAATPQTFLDSMVANLPDPVTGKPDPQKQKDFRDTHPDVKALGEFMATHNPPSSYANSEFYSVHTFQFINASKRSTLVRWHFEPVAGVKRLTDEELKTAPTRFLDEDLTKRAKEGTISWNMIVTIGEPGDEQNDPTVYWPSERQEIKAGVLTINAVTPEAGGACEKINFDPLVIANGIAPTNDPVLLFRSPAYAKSYAKRLTAQ